MKKPKQKNFTNKIEPKLDPVIKPTIALSTSWHKWLVFAIAILLYANTLTHQFTQDDAIVIYENSYTKAGISGLPSIFTKDTFSGFFKDDSKLNLVSGGRYRPFTLAMFALEYQLVGNKPWLGHLMNILLFGFLCLMIYKLLEKLFLPKIESENYLILAISLIFAVHPIHTEAVANIKGRDEIMAMLGSVISLYYFIKHADNQHIKYLFISLLSLFVGLLSKENAITYLAIAPLALYFFRNFTLKKAILKSVYLMVPVLLFMVIRTAIVGNNFGNQPLELMNNPFLKLVNGVYIPFSFGEKLATIFYTLWKYVFLLFIPISLTHDYYPRYIDIMHFTDSSVIISIIFYFALFFLAIKGLKKRTLISFGIIYFLLTTSIVSNIIFPIGTNMSERFMFMPSLGFAIVIGFLLVNIYEKMGKITFSAFLGIILLLFSIKTFSRNLVWESDFKLFTTDVKTSTNSAKVLNAAAGALSTESVKETNPDKKQEMLAEALDYINKAIEVHPTYKNAYFLKGNILNYQKEYQPSIEAYEMALAFDPTFADAQNNYAITLRDAGKMAGEIEHNLPKSEKYLLKSDSLLPNQAETIKLLGVLNGIKGEHDKAIDYFEKAIKIDSQNASAYMNLGTAYNLIGKTEEGKKMLEQAQKLDPTLFKK